MDVLVKDVPIIPMIITLDCSVAVPAWEWVEGGACGWGAAGAAVYLGSPVTHHDPHPSHQRQHTGR